MNARRMSFGLGMLALLLIQGLVRSIAAETNAPVEAKLPPQQWHLADSWGRFSSPPPPFEPLDVEVTIDHDVSTNVNLYLKLP
jgi:hypothetical protein